jgi:hypothetical protein
MIDASMRGAAAGGVGLGGAVALVIVLAGCNRPSPPPDPGLDAGAAAPTKQAAPSGSAKPSAGPVTWTGAYQATPGTLFVPDGGEFSGWKFHGDDASTGLGAGTLTLTVDGASGRATGTADGPLGAMVVSGVVTDGELSARVDPKDATAPTAGFTGVALGKVSGATLKGTMHLSAATGNVIREATFELAQK